MTTEPLYKCVIKKSVSVTKGIVKTVGFGFVVGIGLIIIVFLGIEIIYISVNSTLGLLQGYINAICNFFGSIFSLLSWIPWYVYVGPLATLLIVGYSTVWCMRERVKRNMSEVKVFDCQED